MSFATDILKKAAGFASEHTPAILTAIGVAGTVTTAALAVKATITVMDAIRDEEDSVRSMRTEVMTNKERAEFVMESGLWQRYIPAAAVCLGTIGCIIGANHVSSKRAASVAAAYSLLERGATRFEDKVVEKFGEKKAQQVRSEVLEDRLRERDPFEDDSIEVYGKPERGSVFLDGFSQIYIWTTREEIDRALNDIGRTIINVGHATLADFYYRMDIPAPTYASDIGWSSDDELPAAVYSTAATPGDIPVNAFDFTSKPNPRYLRFH